MELEQVKSGSQALAPMQKILKVTSLQKEIEECRRTEECLAEAIRPLISKALELSQTVDNQLIVLCKLDEAAEESAQDASAEALQQIVEKENELTK